MLLCPILVRGQQAKGESFPQFVARVASEGEAAYKASPYADLSRNYFLRFCRDPGARPGDKEVLIGSSWRIVLSDEASPLAELFAGYFAEFMRTRMNVGLKTERRASEEIKGAIDKAIILTESGGGDPASVESFTITADPHSIKVGGQDSRGLRDGIVRLVDLIGFREAPILKLGEQIYRPRLRVRLGTIPRLGTSRDAIFMGYNAVFAGGGSLYSLSTSDAIPELAVRRSTGALAAGVEAAKDARRHGMKTYAFIDTRQKFPKDDPVFKAHPDLRGALTWKADGEYVLCTEHPLVKQFLRESVQGIFRADPQLDGIVIIIGGEGFYHCFMRPFGVQKGHTNCERCEPLGADTVVSDLCNLLGEAIREVNPKAEVIAWPYSAEHVWSADKAQSGFIRKLKPGAAILTEIEKDEYVEKPRGVKKHLWDYSIDLIGPGERAKNQIAACKAAGIPIYFKSEPELGFEAPRLPHIPCLDRWVDRAEALATCGADGAFVFPAFRPFYGTSAAEVQKFEWWTPTPAKETLLLDYAARIAGPEGAPHLRKAWGLVSKAIEFSPELPPYYTGPYYLGPAHPMCADPKAELPQVFYGYYLFQAEISDAEGMKRQPTFFTKPRGDAEVFGWYYRQMEGLMKDAVAELDAAKVVASPRCPLMFRSEESATRWLYHTARTHANFYESCRLRDRLLAAADIPSRTEEETSAARADLRRWNELLLDEKANTEAALPVMEADVRLDFYYGGDHTFPHGAEMIRAKLEILKNELNNYLPSVAARLGINPDAPAKK